jgi:predicted acyl esterase
MAEKHSQFWETRNYLANLADKDHVPASLHMIGGWFDFFLPQQFIDLKQARENGCEARITIGPWHHWDVTKV